MNLHPIDQNPNKAVGLKYPVTADSKNFFGLNYTTIDQVKTNILNFLLTNEGERIMMPPDYGFGANQLLFETEEDADIKLNEKLSIKFQKWLPYVILNSSLISPDDYNAQKINIKLSFSTYTDPTTEQQLEFSMIVE